MSHRPSAAMTKRPGRQGLLLLAALAAAVLGVVAIVFAVLSQRSAPEPPASARGTISVQRPTTPAPSTPAPNSPSSSTSSGRGSTSTSAPSTTATPRAPRSLPRSSPTSIEIPAIGVHSSVISLGRDADGALAVPQPGPDLDKVAWYDGSPTPGETGPSVLEGHIDTTQGPSIFYRLGAMRPGDQVQITRADGSTATFTVNAVRSYATHADFPAGQVFGSDLAYPTLRLITCSNFDHASGHYAGNTVVYAHLTAIHR